MAGLRRWPVRSPALFLPADLRDPYVLGRNHGDTRPPDGRSMGRPGTGAALALRVGKRASVMVSIAVEARCSNTAPLLFVVLAVAG